jgi:hypothetical protein
MRISRLLVIPALGALLALMALPGLAAIPLQDTEVTVGSNDLIFSQNKQNEPTVAIDPSNPLILAAGANDNIDLEACNAGDPTTCPFTTDVGVTGVQFSLDGGASWIQPEYTGWSARHCLGPEECMPQEGPIGTLPWYFENGLVSDGDPIVAFGPQPDEGGDFAWDNGSRLYFSNLTGNFSGGGGFKGQEAIGVSRTDDPATAALGGEVGKAAWMPPVLVSGKLSQTDFSDKESLWADTAATSDHFGNVYVCWVEFRSFGGAPEPVMLTRSTDGGDTWTDPKQLSPAENARFGRQGCTIRTDSEGTVYVFWEGGDPRNKTSTIVMRRSFDGGRKWDKARHVTEVVDVGAFDPNQGRLTFDGLAGARTNSFPSVDIANGAPTGADATDQIVMTWSDGRDGLNSEHALVQTSLDGGDTWSEPVEAEEPGDRPDFPAIAVSPDGTDAYLVYMGFLTPWQETTADPRIMQGVVRHADIDANGTIGAWATLHRGAEGDARGSSANGLTSEFLGDYNFAGATNDAATFVWNDVREASDCPAIDAYRQDLSIGAPEPQQECAPTFGNSSIFSTTVGDPT